MKITFLGIGSIKDPQIRGAAEEYVKRTGRYAEVEVLDVKGARYGKGGPGQGALREEGERVLKRLKAMDGAFVVVLGEGGRQYTSDGLAGFMKRHMDGGTRQVVFIVGGPFGLHPDVVSRADAEISLSKMTFPHDLARLVLAEQVYRAFTIIRGEPYSH